MPCANCTPIYACHDGGDKCQDPPPRPTTARELLAALPLDTKVSVMLRGGFKFDGGINETPDPETTLCLYAPFDNPRKPERAEAGITHYVIDMADVVAFTYRVYPSGTEHY